MHRKIYQEALAQVKQHHGTSGQIALAKCILSLYNSRHAFAISEILQSTDSNYTRLILSMIAEYSLHGETEDLRVAGRYVYDAFPRLIELSEAMSIARSEIKNKWGKRTRKRNEKTLPKRLNLTTRKATNGRLKKRNQRTV